jgi:hypothetical protein
MGGAGGGGAAWGAPLVEAVLVGLPGACGVCAAAWVWGARAQREGREGMLLEAHAFTRAHGLPRGLLGRGRHLARVALCLALALCYGALQATEWSHPSSAWAAAEPGYWLCALSFAGCALALRAERWRGLQPHWVLRAYWVVSLCCACVVFAGTAESGVSALSVTTVVAHCLLALLAAMRRDMDEQLEANILADLEVRAGGAGAVQALLGAPAPAPAPSATDGSWLQRLLKRTKRSSSSDSASSNDPRDRLLSHDSEVIPVHFFAPSPAEVAEAAGRQRLEQHPGQSGREPGYQQRGQQQDPPPDQVEGQQQQGQPHLHQQHVQQLPPTRQSVAGLRRLTPALFQTTVWDGEVVTVSSTAPGAAGGASGGGLHGRGDLEDQAGVTSDAAGEGESEGEGDDESQGDDDIYDTVELDEARAAAYVLLARIAADPSLCRNHRKWLFLRYDRCLLGSQVVELLVEGGSAPDQRAAVALGRRMIKYKCLEKLTRRRYPFVGGTELVRLSLQLD